MTRSHLLFGFGLVLGCGPDAAMQGGDEVASETSVATGTGTETETVGTETETETSDASDTDVPEGCADNAPGAEIVACVADSASGFTAADGWLYFGQSASIERVRPDGSERELIVDGLGDVRELQVVGETLYWIEFFDGLVRARPLAGGAIENLGGVLFKPSSFVVHDAQIYVTQYDFDLDILRVPLDGSASVAFEALVDFGGDLAIAGTDLYWVTNTNNGNVANVITRAPLAGGEPLVISNELKATAGLVADTTHLYWTRGSADGSAGGAYRWPLAGGEVETLAPVSNQVGGIALDADSLYWTLIDVSPDHDGHSGEVWRVAKPGGSPELVIDSQIYPESLLVDETHVYWANSQAIARLPL